MSDDVEMPTCITITWYAEDIKFVASQMEKVLTDRQIAWVLQTMKDRYDASVGISWDTVWYWIGEVK